MKRERRAVWIDEQVRPVQAVRAGQRVSSPPEVPHEDAGVGRIVAGHIDGSERKYARQGQRGGQAAGREHVGK